MPKATPEAKIQLTAECRKVLGQLLENLTASDEIPSLGIEVHLHPGEHWLFHPRLANLRWWWDEIVTYGKIVRELVINASAPAGVHVAAGR